jgi:hypothetical protein
MRSETLAQGRGEAQQDAQRHGRAEEEPHPGENAVVVRRQVVSQGSSRCRPRRRYAARGGDEPGVGRCHVGSGAQFGQPYRAGYHRTRLSRINAAGRPGVRTFSRDARRRHRQATSTAATRVRSRRPVTPIPHRRQVIYAVGRGASRLVMASWASGVAGADDADLLGRRPQLGQLVGGEFDRCGGRVLLQPAELLVPGMGTIQGCWFSSQANASWAGWHRPWRRLR